MKRILVFSFDNLVAAVRGGVVSDDQMVTGLYCLDASYDEVVTQNIGDAVCGKIAQMLVDAHGASRTIWGESLDQTALNAMLKRNGFPEYVPVSGEAFSIAGLEVWIDEKKIELQVI